MKYKYTLTIKFEDDINFSGSQLSLMEYDFEQNNLNNFEIKDIWIDKDRANGQ